MTPFVVGVQSAVNGLPTLRGVCVGYVTKEKSRLRQFFTRRAIIPGGPALADDVTSAEVSALMRAVISTIHAEPFNRQPIYIETRNFEDYSQWQSAFIEAGFSYKKHLNFHVDCTDREVMQGRLSDNRRRQLRRSDATTAPAQSEQEIREWYAVLDHLYRTKVKTPLWPVEFFLDAYRQGVATFMLVKHDHRVIGGTMMVMSERCVYEWFECGMNATYRDQYPSVMATWAGIIYAHEHCYLRYDMMGAGQPDKPYGVRDFKSEFGGTMVQHGRFLHVCQPCLYHLGTCAVRLLKR